MKIRKLVKQKVIINPINLQVKSDKKEIKALKNKKYSKFEIQIMIRMRKKNINMNEKPLNSSESF